jgi:Tfp pilus assembly protein PilX
MSTNINSKNGMSSERGIAVYVAVTITAALVLISFAILNLAIRQVGISGAGRDSQAAFYAADSGVECALFWDLRNTTVPGVSAFSTSTAVQQISCNGQNLTPTRAFTSGSGTSTFSFTFSPDPYCVTVDVGKHYVGLNPMTLVEARGYNSCAAGENRRLERAIKVTY